MLRPRDDAVTLHAALSYEQGVSGGWTPSPEFRLRIIDLRVGTQVYVTMGVRYRPGS